MPTAPCARWRLISLAAARPCAKSTTNAAKPAPRWLMPPPWGENNRLKCTDRPYGDERFGYVGLTRAGGAPHPARVLAQPVVTKVEGTAKLCAPKGLVIARVPRRTKADYARARRWRWGDAVMEESTSPGRPGERRDP